MSNLKLYIKHILIIVIITMSGQVFANTYPQKMISVLSGNSILDVTHYYSYLQEKYGAPYQESEGAFWFKTKENFFGLDVEETFISNGDSLYNFIGIVIKGSPEKVVEQKIPWISFKKQNPDDPYSLYISKDRTQLLWFGNDKSKIVFLIKNHKYKKPHYHLN